MSNTRKLLFSLSAVLILSGMDCRDRLPRSARHSIRAYTITQHVESAVPQSAVVITETRTTAQRADGSRVQTEEVPRIGYRQRTINLANGLYMQVEDETKEVSTTRLDSAKYLQHRGAIRTVESGCTLPPEGKTLSPNTIVGYKTISGIHTNEVVIFTGAHLWFAPELNCEVIQNTFTFSGAARSVSTLKLDRIVYGDPVPALFVVSADYAEVPPSKMVADKLRKANLSQALINQAIANSKRADAAYFQNRAEHF